MREAGCKRDIVWEEFEDGRGRERERVGVQLGR